MSAAMGKGTEIQHAIYGNGKVCNWPPVEVDTHQWTGSAVWCYFYKPQTAIAGNWPYLIPISDIQGAAIAPPVAAGSVDTLDRYAPFGCEGGGMRPSGDGGYVEYADAIAWGAQQRGAGKRDGIEGMMKISRRFLRHAAEAKSRVAELEAKLEELKRELWCERNPGERPHEGT